MSGARLKQQDNVRELVPVAAPPTAENNRPNLGPVAAARLEDWCLAYSIPSSTMRALQAAQKGPRTFKIGRLIFCTRDDFCAWLKKLAGEGGTGPLSAPAGRCGKAY